MIDYARLEARSHEENWAIKYKRFTVWNEHESPALRMAHKEFPAGLKEQEGITLLGTINDYGLKRGFEVATGFGLSALWAGLGFRKNKGKLVTMDAYIEEERQDPEGYRSVKPIDGDQMRTDVLYSDGYRSAQQLVEKYSLQETVVPTVGWSPNSVEYKIRETFDEPLDYAFIDGGHWDEAVIRDVDAISPFLDKERFIVFFHDLHCLKEAVGHAESVLGGEMQVIVTPPNGWNLGCIARGL